MKLKILKKIHSGYIKSTMYSCPCGQGIIEEENDYTAGHRDCFAFLNCLKCEKEFFIDYNGNQLHWRLAVKYNHIINHERQRGDKMDNLWLLTEERPI